MQPDEYKWYLSMWNHYARLIEENPDEICSTAMRVGDNIYLYVHGGVRIKPKDASYTRFIADSWYDGVDIEAL
jgi:hypothetical protein